ncbi:MAG: histidine phosphatase family protein [Paracoccaceae bacterium]
MLPASGPRAAIGPFERLGEWRTHAIMTHAVAPGAEDPATLDPGDCATQRNLSNIGRAQAQKAGALLRAADASIDRVLSSRYCRCLDTARLLDLGAVETLALLDPLADGEAGARVETLAARLVALPPETTAVLVTHPGLVAAMLGRHARSGEIFVVRLSATGGITPLGSRAVEA